MLASKENPYATWGLVADQAETNVRAGFIRATYLHLFGAIVAFVGIEAVLVNSGAAQKMAEMIVNGGRFGWLFVLLGFMGISYLANNWARSATSVGTQYMGLGLYVVGEAIIFAPLVYVAAVYGPPNVLTQAALLTGLVFAGLTAFVFVTGADFSFLKTALAVAGMGALGVIVASAIFGFSMGIVFTAAMIVFASGYILYDTSNVLHHYRIGQHVAASLALFASVALLFWYILQLLMSANRR
jgi:FtsH-binding integral membrane protein